MQKLKVIVMAPYDNWRRALEKDDRINLLTEKSTVYRSWIALALIHVFMPCVMRLNESIMLFGYWKFFLIQIAALIFLSLAYRKQVAYVRKCVQFISQ